MERQNFSLNRRDKMPNYKASEKEKQMLERIFQSKPDKDSPKAVIKVVHEPYGEWIYYKDGTKSWYSIGD